MIKKIILSSDNLNSLLNNLQSYKNNYNPINILENIINTST